MVSILAIETSCDETSAAVIQNGQVLSNCVSSQKVHEKYGGVVPELASRAHETEIVGIVRNALQIANIHKKQLSAIAYTKGPGLLGSLLVGCCFAKSLAQALSKPLIAVNHMQAHIFANFISEEKPNLPLLSLVVSGGHTQLVVMENMHTFNVIGNCLDDAVGEAFDKISKLFGLPYPGGPYMDTYAKQGNLKAFSFPIADVEGLDFSFSGIKTFVHNFIQKQSDADTEFVSKNLHDLCASVQYTLVETLLRKLITAYKHTKINQIAVCGGVAANSELRKRILEAAVEFGWKVFIPHKQYCTDNAAMVGIAAYYSYLNNDFSDLTDTPEARLSI